MARPSSALVSAALTAPDVRMRWIARRALSRKITRPTLAAKLGLSETTVFRAFMESAGPRGIRDATVEKYAKAVGFTGRANRALFNRLTAADLDAARELLRSALAVFEHVHPSTVAAIGSLSTPANMRRAACEFFLARDIGGGFFADFLGEKLNRSNVPQRSPEEKRAGETVFTLVYAYKGFGLTDVAAGDLARDTIVMMQERGLIANESLFLRQFERDAWVALASGSLDMSLSQMMIPAHLKGEK